MTMSHVKLVRIVYFAQGHARWLKAPRGMALFPVISDNVMYEIQKFYVRLSISGNRIAPCEIAE